MTVRFENTVEDGVAWATYAWTGTPERRRELRKHDRQASIIAGGSVFIWLQIIGAGVETVSVGVAVGLAAAGGVAHYVWRVLGFRRGVEAQARQARKKNGRRRWWQDEMEVEAGPGGLRTRHSGGEFLMRWPAVEAVRATEKHLYLEFDEGQFLQVPLHAFGPGEAERFRALIDHYRTAGELEAPASAAAVATPAAAPAVGPWWRSQQAAGVNTGSEAAPQRVGGGGQ